MALTAQRRLFIEEYLQCWNATEAAKRANYSEKTAYQQGYRLLKNVEVQEAIEARLAEKAMSADEVLLRLSEQARGAAEEFIDVLEGGPILNWARLDEMGLKRLIKKLKTDKDGKIEVEFYDAQAALVHLGKYHGLFVDRQETKHSGAIKIKVVEVIKDRGDDDRSGS